MTEVDENNFRVLLTRFREEKPDEFILLLLQSLMNRLGDNSISAFRHKDDDQIPVGLVVIFKGIKPAAWAEESLLELQGRLKKFAEEQED